MNYKTIRHSILALLLIALGGCSGGTGGTGSPAPTTLSAGTVTALGSVFVNGVEYITTTATITRDDSTVPESELRAGMVVEVEGSTSSSTLGTATTVRIEEAVRGTIESKTGTDTSGTMVVLGQTVQIDDATIIDNSVCGLGESCGTHAERFAAMGAGEVVEVHGHRRPDGSIAASYLEGKLPSVTKAVRGTIASHNAGAQTFTIGALTVNYNGATITNMPTPSVSNWNGSFVEVKGTCLGNPVCGTLTATKVEPEGLAVTSIAQAEYEGFVTAMTSTSDFTVNNQHVITTPTTIFSGGLQADIAVGTKMEVEGVLSAGIITATKVSFRDNIRLESDIATIVGNNLTLAGLPGITVTVNSFTEYKGGATGLGDFIVTDHVRIRGRLAAGNTVIVSELEKRSANTQVILQAQATSASNPNLVLLNITVDTTALTDNNFLNVDDSVMGRTAFFAAALNKLVKARGDQVGGDVTWAEVELEE